MGFSDNGFHHEVTKIGRTNDERQVWFNTRHSGQTNEIHYVDTIQRNVWYGTTHLLIDQLVRNHGVPRNITSDRDRLFTSKYWKTLIARLRTKLKLSTAYHPTTDRQSERKIQTIKIQLRHYYNYKQDNWVSLLPIVQLAMNNHISETTGLSPFFANHGFHPNNFTTPKESPGAEKALQ